MKKTFAIFLTLVFLLSISTSVLAANTTAYADVPAGHWAYTAVNELARVGIIDGYGDKTFRGDKLMTRYEMAQIVEKAMENSNKATAVQKALIDKLAIEFAMELNKLDTRVTKLESKTNFSFQSESLMVFGMDNPPAGVPKVSGGDAYQWRERLYLHADVNPNLVYDARIATSPGELANKSASPTSGNDLYVDRSYFTGTNVLGFDQFKIGRQGMMWGQGLAGYKTSYNDGLAVFKKLGDSVDLQMGAFVVAPDPAAGVTGNTQELQYASFGIKVDNNLKFTTSVYNNNEILTAASTPLNYGYSSSKGFDVGFREKMGPWTLIGEYVTSKLNNAVNAPSDPKAFAFQITNGTNFPEWFYPCARFIVDYQKPGTDAWALSYRSVDKGAIWNGAGFPIGKTISSPLYTGHGGIPFTNNVDDMKGYFLTYEKVIAKGVVMSLEYQNLKFTDTGLPFDKCFNISLQYVF